MSAEGAKCCKNNLTMELTLVTFISLLGVAYTVKHNLRLNFRYDRKTIELPITVDVFQPQGLEVSIPDTKGLEVFSFHGKVISPRSKYEQYTQSLAEDITKSTNGRWVFENNHIQLQPDDVLHFWVFIQYRGAGQRFNNLRYKVEYLTPNPILDESSKPISYRPSALADYHPTTITPSNGPKTSNTGSPSDTQAPFIDTTRVTNNSPNNRGLEGCVCNENSIKDIWFQMNATAVKQHTLEDKIFTLEEKISSLTEIIEELANNQEIGTKLMLTGNLPVHTNAVEDIRHLIIEKLKLRDLSTKILQASYKPYGIDFEMSSEIDKLRILRRSRDLLSKLSYQIEDPQKPPIDVRSD